jgi:hypothetical protein
LVNSTIHRIWTFVENISYEEASSNCLRGCPRLVRSNPALLDNPEFPIPANREPWSQSRPRKKRRVSTDNDLDRDLGAAFVQIEMIEAGQVMTGANGVDKADVVDEAV